MTGAELLSLIRRKTRTTSGTYADADALVDVNLFKDEIASKIQRTRPEIWNIPAFDDLEADQREYAFPSDVLNNLTSLELDLENDDEYKLAIPLQKAPQIPLTEDEITENYDNSNPAFFIRRNAIYILSGTITAVTDGIKLVYSSFPANLANLTGSTDLSVDPSTTTHGVPREFHELLARRVSIHYKDLNGIKLSREDLMYEQDLEKQLEEFGNPIQDLEEYRNMPQDTTGQGYNL
jgi:hypothetical protein